MDSTTYTIGPNKKGAIKFCAILSPVLIGLGILFIFSFPGEKFELFYLVTVGADRLGAIVAVLSIVPVLILIYTLKSKKRIVLDESGIKLSDKVRIDWDDISHCQTKSYLGRPFLLNIVPKTGHPLMVSWHQVDFGLEKLADLICEHLPDSETPAE